MKEITDLGIADYINMFTPASAFDNELVISEISGHVDSKIKDFSPIRLNAYSIFWVLEGEITVEMNCQEYQLIPGMVLEMGIDCLVDNLIFSTGMKGYHLLISRDLMKELINPLASLFPSNMLKLKYMYPLYMLDAKTLDGQLTVLRQMQGYIADKEHYYRRQLIKNALGILIMELNHTLWKKYGGKVEKVSGYRTIKEEFRQLLIEFCKTEHEVSFYADKLCITPDHLSKVMRDYSGRSAIKWINHALATEAKVLLRKPDMTVQEVAEILHFSDQSTFGKFFKKQAGVSPLVYKKGK